MPEHQPNFNAVMIAGLAVVGTAVAVLGPIFVAYVTGQMKGLRAKLGKVYTALKDARRRLAKCEARHAAREKADAETKQRVAELEASKLPPGSTIITPPGAP